MRILSTLLSFVLLLVTASCSEMPSASQADDAALQYKSDASLIVLGASSLAKSDKGAIRYIPDPNCGVIDGTGALFYVDCLNQIATYSSNGNASIVVQASGVPNPTGKFIRWGPQNPGWEFEAVFDAYFGITEPPYPCAVLDHDSNLAFTLKWSGTVTPSGQATLSCHYQDKWAYQW